MAPSYKDTGEAEQTVYHFPVVTVTASSINLSTIRLIFFWTDEKSGRSFPV